VVAVSLKKRNDASAYHQFAYHRTRLPVNAPGYKSTRNEG
jgi:hypothetical protein